MKFQSSVLFIIAVVFASACAAPAVPTPIPPIAPAENQTTVILDTELRDVNSGQTFKLRDFEGKVVVLEFMAVWCPTCLEQQREIKAAEEQLARDDIVSVSLDVDPNEDATRLLGHTQRNDLGWRFALSPPEMTRALQDEFGANVLNVPLAPVAIIDREQNIHLLRFGVKRADELVTEIEKYL